MTPPVSTLRRILTSTTMTAVAVALVLASGAFVAHDVVTFRAGLVRELSTQAAILGRLSTSALVFQDPESAATTLSALRAEPHIVSAALYAPGGPLFASYVRDAGGKPATVPLGDGQEFRGGRLVLHRAVVLDDAPLATLVLESDLTEMRNRLLRYAGIVLFVLAASSVLAYVTASRLQGAISEPILRLADTAHTVSTGQDYGVRALPVTTPRELSTLVSAFNHMLDQIGERDAALKRAHDHLETQVQARTRDLRGEITERRALEEELRTKNRELEAQSRRVEQATRLKSEFLANMSHELRTPLNAIVGFAELLHDEKVGPLFAGQKECVSDILTSGQHLLRLINDILDLSKVEAGKMEFHPEPVEAFRVVGEVRDILRGMGAKKRIAVQTECDPRVGTVVLDPGKLKQVLYNFLSNALKFTPEGGRVVIRTAAEGDDAFRLEVEDSGVGIKPEDHSRLFVEFQQLDASAAKTQPGTGLGLALTKRIVEAQGGRVGVDSVPGRGSRFFAVLPRVSGGTPRPSAPAAATLKPAVPGARRILVIEDDERQRQWLLETLVAAGYAVEACATGHAAIDRCRAQAFDGVTMDLFLPDMTGWDVLREIRSRGLNQATPVIVVTVVAEKGLGTGFAIHDYLVKPVEAAHLLASLKRAGVEARTHAPILVVDDDPQALRMMEATLSSLGYEVRSAGNGVSGIDLVSRETVAAVVLDLGMPDMDGFEFLERFRAHPRGRTTPVIVWTARDLTREDLARLSRAAQAVVLKSDGGARRLIEELRVHIPPPPEPGSLSPAPNPGEHGHGQRGGADGR